MKYKDYSILIICSHVKFLIKAIEIFLQPVLKLAIIKEVFSQQQHSIL